MSVTTFRKKNRDLAAQATAILDAERPMTLRQLFYRCVSAGIIPNTPKEYQRLGAVMTRLRESGDVPRTWIVDHVRATLKPSSWTGLRDYAETVGYAYRLDFWASLPHHVEVFVEKDAIAGTIQPVTAEYDIALRVCRGYSSVSFAGEIADIWAKVTKPIFAYYLGDFDASGFDLERDLREKLERYSGRTILTYEAGDEPTNVRKSDRSVYWRRLGVTYKDFDDFDLVRLPVKHTDNRAAGFVREWGDDCAEIDALPPTELRRRVQEAIERHIDQRRWRRLQAQENREKASVLDMVASLAGA